MSTGAISEHSTAQVPHSAYRKGDPQAPQSGCVCRVPLARLDKLTTTPVRKPENTPLFRVLLHRSVQRENKSKKRTCNEEYEYIAKNIPLVKCRSFSNRFSPCH